MSALMSRRRRRIRRDDAGDHVIQCDLHPAAGLLAVASASDGDVPVPPGVEA